MFYRKSNDSKPTQLSSLVLQISEKKRHYEPIKFEIEDGQIEATNTTKYR